MLAHCLDSTGQIGQPEKTRTQCSWWRTYGICSPMFSPFLVVHEPLHRWRKKCGSQCIQHERGYAPWIWVGTVCCFFSAVSRDLRWNQTSFSSSSSYRHIVIVISSSEIAPEIKPGECSRKYPTNAGFYKLEKHLEMWNFPLPHLINGRVSISKDLVGKWIHLSLALGIGSRPPNLRVIRFMWNPMDHHFLSLHSLSCSASSHP